jgi:hypothetical protein
LYGYEEDSNRTSLTTREPGTEGKCATSGGTKENHTYDGADRLIDTGVTYDPLGNTTKLPASDAGGYELKSSFYVDGQVETQTQNGQENVYSIDPAGRVRKTVSKGTNSGTTINHYAGPGESLSWKEEEGGKYTRLIPGPDGTLCGTETNGGAPELQLHDLQGDVVATAALSESATKLLSTYNSTEFGVPINGAPPTKYSWLGASGVSSELSSGELLDGTVAYQPQLGRTLQTEAVIPPGMAVEGATDATVAYAAQIAAWSMAANDATGEADTSQYERQKAAEREAEEKACAVASECVEPEEGGGGEEGEGEEAAESGDPVICYAYAYRPKIKIGKGRTSRVTFMGGYGCSDPTGGHRLDPTLGNMSAQLEVCLDERVDGQWVTVEGSCHTHIFNAPAGEGKGFTASCTKGGIYQVWVWAFFWSDEYWTRNHTRDTYEFTCV